MICSSQFPYEGKGWACEAANVAAGLHRTTPFRHRKSVSNAIAVRHRAGRRSRSSIMTSLPVVSLHSVRTARRRLAVLSGNPLWAAGLDKRITRDIQDMGRSWRRGPAPQKEPPSLIRSPTQSSSASRFTAGAAGFLNLSQSGERPERTNNPSALGSDGS